MDGLAEFEVHIDDPTYGRSDDWPNAETQKRERAFASEFEKALPKAKVKAFRGNTGHGADFPTIAVLVWLAFLKGKDVHENFQHWKEMAIGFVKGLKKAVGKKRYRVNADAAKALVLAKIYGESKVIYASIESVQELTLRGQLLEVGSNSAISRHPEQIYVILVTFQFGGRVFIVKSTGQFCLEYEMPPLQWEAFENWL
jgi:hypothetical protein